MIKALQTVLGVLVVSLLSGSAFGYDPASLEGRTYEGSSIKVEFLNESVGRMFEDGKETEFSYRIKDYIVDFYNFSLESEFMHRWFFRKDGTLLVSADYLGTLTLVSDLQTFICGAPWASIHGRVARKEHIPRTCGYPWDRFHYDDGYTCDVREACH